MTPDVDAAKHFATILREWWSFNQYQQHTHSWHTREDFIEKVLPDLLTPPPKLRGLLWTEYDGVFWRVEDNPFGSYTVRINKEIRADGVFVSYQWGFRAYSGRDTPESPRNVRGNCDSIDHGKQLCWADYQRRVSELYE